jgi:hypothetical protein
MFLLRRAVDMDSSLYDRRFLGDVRAYRSEKRRCEAPETPQQVTGTSSGPERG